MRTSSIPFIPVILAGGSGKRFWPVSRPERPKQFVPLFQGKSLFQLALERTAPLAGSEPIIIVTGEKHRRLVRAQARGVCPRKKWIMLSEPTGRNTAPAVAWAAHRFARRNPEAIMGVFPSDHLIQKTARFVQVVRKAQRLAQDNFLVTMGVVPTRPETGYGYLKTRTEGRGPRSFLRVESFVEKPDERRARQFWRSGRYLWNSGMFVWRLDVIIAALQRYAPNIDRALSRAVRGEAFRRAWESLPSISIDYAVLEKADNVAAVPATDCGWSDVGSWQALWEVLPKDRNGNAFVLFEEKGRVLRDCRNCLFWSDQDAVAGVGLEDMVVVQSNGALLVCPKDKSQTVRHLAQGFERQ